MDALEFLKERKRMCSLHEACGECPFRGAKCALSISASDENYKRVIAIVEQWSKEHPRKTRQSMFLEQFPNVKLDTNGIIDISPCRVDQEQYSLSGKDCCRFQSCFDCRREFWLTELE